MVPGGCQPLDLANWLEPQACLYRQPVNHIHHRHLLLLLGPKAKYSYKYKYLKVTVFNLYFSNEDSRSF